MARRPNCHRRFQVKHSLGLDPWVDTGSHWEDGSKRKRGSDSIRTEQALGRQQGLALGLLPFGRARTKDETRERARSEEGRADHNRRELEAGVENYRPEHEPACSDCEEVADPRALFFDGIETAIERIGDRIEAINRIPACRAG